MDYSIYKDCNVRETVEKIKTILDKTGIEIEEDILMQSIPSEFQPYSLRLNMFGDANKGTNGKGTTLENAKASGYSEFMERLQNQANNIAILNNEFFHYSPDEKVTSAEHMKKLAKYFGNYETIFNYNKLCSRFLKSDNQAVYVPFYSVKDKKTVYIPIYAIRYSQGSNGMCAGNTPEEALVQGMSEICERYAMKEIINKKIVLQDIPENVYSKYEKLLNLKKYIENCGWNVWIKDASLGGKLPVICSIFENKEDKDFSVNFGAQPSLPVAIERTLTEFAQGRNLVEKLDAILPYNKSNLNRYMDLSYSYILKCNPQFTHNEILDNIFFNKKNKNCKFKQQAWIEEHKYYSNKEILKFLLKKMSKICKNELYIRNNSFLGFPSYYIFIPKMSIVDKKDLKYTNKQLNFEKWILYTKDLIPEHKKIDSLISALDFKINNDNSFTSTTRNSFVCNLSHEYVIFLCYVIKNDIENILKYANIISEKNIVTDDNKKLIEIIIKYYSLKKENTKEIDIYENLNLLYPEEEINNFKLFIKNLSFERVKKIISNSNIKGQKENNKSAEEINKEKEIQQKCLKVKNNLIEKYIKNTPSQMELADIFK